MKKKLIAFLSALIICGTATIGAVTVSAKKAEDSGAKTTATEKKEKKEKTPNPNISADYTSASLFDTSKMHTINIIVDEKAWADMIKNVEDKKYVDCDVEIDGEVIKGVSLRPKGNASLRAIAKDKNGHTEQFSWKIEFDHKDNTTTYHGLDKLALNNLGQDVTCTKDYITYQMMNDMGVNSPMCSYTVLQKNGEDFGLYLAVEALEDSFVKRCYGDSEIDMYKPESIEKIDRTKQSNLSVVFQILNGTFYADKTPNDRVDMFYDVWGGKYSEIGFDKEFNTVPTCRWAGDDVSAYEDFWEESVFNCTDEDKKTFVASLNTLNNGKDSAEKQSVLDVDQCMRYFAVNNFVNNNDGLMGIMKHNFYVCENDGVLSYVPWDYNTAYGGMHFENAIRDMIGSDLCLEMDTERMTANVMSLDKNLVNFPIDTPLYTGENDEIPMMSAWLDTEEGKAKYHEIYDEYIKKFESGDYEKMRQQAQDLIAPYIEKNLTFYTKEQFETASESMKLYLKYRSEAIRKQLDGEMPATKDGQAAQPDTLIEPTGMSTGSMAVTDGTAGCPPPQILNPIIKAFLGNDPDYTASHFSDVCLAYLKNPLTKYDRVPELAQTEMSRVNATTIMHRKYATDCFFTSAPPANAGQQGGAQGGPPAGAGAPEEAGSETSESIENTVTEETAE